MLLFVSLQIKHTMLLVSVRFFSSGYFDWRRKNRCDGFKRKGRYSCRIHVHSHTRRAREDQNQLVNVEMAHQMFIDGSVIYFSFGWSTLRQSLAPNKTKNRQNDVSIKIFAVRKARGRRRKRGILLCAWINMCERVHAFTFLTLFRLSLWWNSSPSCSRFNILLRFNRTTSNIDCAQHKEHGRWIGLFLSSSDGHKKWLHNKEAGKKKFLRCST